MEYQRLNVAQRRQLLEQRLYQLEQEHWQHTLQQIAHKDRPDAAAQYAEPILFTEQAIVALRQLLAELPREPSPDAAH